MALYLNLKARYGLRSWTDTTKEKIETDIMFIQEF